VIIIKKIVAFISVVILGFIWIISGAILILTIMKMGYIDNISDIFKREIILIDDFSVKGYILILVSSFSVIGVIKLNEYIIKK